MTAYDQEKYGFRDKLHDPGECPYTRDYCSGIAHLCTDPWDEVMVGDITPRWMCDGKRKSRLEDI